MINEVLLNCFPRNWDEDFITRSIISNLRDHFIHSVIETDKVYGHNTNINWDLYKNTNRHNAEYRYGDIGILVKLDFGKNKSIEGVAFLEAKRIYHNFSDDNKSSYKALSKSQLIRLSKSPCGCSPIFQIPCCIAII